jgi:putative two-component system hydrogenase maturation factor HypX/HoxX
MRILLLTHSFNSLTQRVHAELTADGHELAVEFDIADSVTEEAVTLFGPDVIVAPYLRRAVPASVWTRHLTLIVHPGIVGDRGPSALDWAIQDDERDWGVTVLQAEAGMDAGPVWAHATFRMRAATKASLYRNEVTAAAVACLREAIARVPDWRGGRWSPRPLTAFGATRGRVRPLMKQVDRTIDWSHDDTATVLRKLRAADGVPGVADRLFDRPCHLYDAHPATPHLSGTPGQLLGRRHHALLRATIDGAVWIGHVKRGDGPHPFKLPAALALPEANALPEIPGGDDDWQELRYRESADGRVGHLEFDFYNGAMSTMQCRRLVAAIEEAGRRPTRVLVLEGGRDFWSNGIHLNVIESAPSPADESWDNINAMDDACLALLTLTDRITVAALRGNAGAGGCFLALAADLAWGRDGIVLNPHYKNMGNLYGSEYWTYLLPRRVGADRGRDIMRHRLPMLAAEAAAIGLIDACFGADLTGFEAEVVARAAALANDAALAARIEAKARQRAADEAARPLAQWRAVELEQMRRNFYGFDPSYHVARYHFVLKSAHSWTPRHLARHRDLGFANGPGTSGDA